MPPETRARLEIKVLAQDGYTALHIWSVTGSGRGVRRSRVYSVRVPHALDRNSLPSVLRAAARELEIPPSQRYAPAPGGSGAPGGGGGRGPDNLDTGV